MFLFLFVLRKRKPRENSKYGFRKDLASSKIEQNFMTTYRFSITFRGLKNPWNSQLLVSQFSGNNFKTTMAALKTADAKNLNESSEDGFADDESTEERQPALALALKSGKSTTNLSNLVVKRGAPKIKPGRPQQPFVVPQTWPHVPLLKPEHYDAWLPNFPDPQETINSVMRDFIFPGPYHAFFRHLQVRTDLGLVDLDIVDPCLPGHPCILDRMCYRDRVSYACYDQRRLRRGFFGAYF